MFRVRTPITAWLARPLLAAACMLCAANALAQDVEEAAPAQQPENVRVEYAQVLRAEPVFQTLRATSMVERCEASTPVRDDDEHPTGFAYLLRAAERLVAPAIEIAVVGNAEDAGSDALVGAAHERLMPTAVMVRAEPGEGADVTPLLVGREPIDGRATAYVCERFACRLPTTDVHQLREQLSAAERERGGYPAE